MREEEATADRQFSRRHPCHDCPFSRACEPGLTGGSAPTVFIGQAHGPFLLDCNLDRNYHPQAAARPNPRIAQCAGAAIFRSHLRLDERMPQEIHLLPADPGRVFQTAAELLAHHHRTSIEEATAELKRTPPETFLQIEFARLKPDQIPHVSRAG